MTAPSTAPAALVQISPPRRSVEFKIDGDTVSAPEGSTILDACRSRGQDIPTLCYLETLHPVNACRVCVVEVENSRVLVPSCARKVEPGMVVHTDSPRVRHSRKMVLEFLASSVDLSTTPDVAEWIASYDAHPERYGPPAPPAAAGVRDAVHAGHHEPPDPAFAATIRQPVKIDNELYVRDYSKCILCYKCVEACGIDYQNTYAIAVAGRGFDARISTEFTVPLPGSACVYCGNCIAVCPTGALMFTSEHDRRAAGTWDESRQSVTDTICPYCGVGCTLSLHVQDNEIVKVTSPFDVSVTHGNLCIKGRFGWQYVQERHKPGNGTRTNGEPRRPRDIEAARNEAARNEAARNGGGKSRENGHDASQRDRSMGSGSTGEGPARGGPERSGQPGDGDGQGNGHR